jgi:hypothetical protein
MAGRPAAGSERVCVPGRALPQLYATDLFFAAGRRLPAE